MNALIVISLLGVFAMMAEVTRLRKAILPVIISGLIAAIVLNVIQWSNPRSYFSEMIVFDHYAVAFGIAITAITLLWLFIRPSYFTSDGIRPEIPSLLLFSLAGAIVMVSYADLTMLFIGIEILSISLYVLCSSDKLSLRSNEAGLKYFLMGSFATGFLLFGIALIYGAAGSFNLEVIRNYLQSAGDSIPVFFYAGIILMLVGLLFKVSAVPFHFWAPDVYEGAPAPVTAYMATVVKTAAFAALFRLFSTCFTELSAWWAPAIAIVAAITMLTGNIIAVSQKGLKRLLAYSSVAHAGYILLAVVAMNEVSAGAVFLYTVAYSLGSLGVFALADILGENAQVADLRGFASRNPGTAVAVVILTFSLAGIPPVAGFFAKYFLFYSTLMSGYTWLVLVAILSSLIGVYYYFRIIYTMFQPVAAEGHSIDIAPHHRIFFAILAMLSLLIGVLPGWLEGLL
jgi:NADH-quinone oxidoreductase subunit N